MEARVRLINLANGSLSKSPLLTTRGADISEANYEVLICKSIGQTIGMQQIPITGYYDSKGEEIKLPTKIRLSIDGIR